MNNHLGRTSLSTIRQSRYRSKYLTINENGKATLQLSTENQIRSNGLPRYRRNYVRYRESSSRSRSRSRDHSKYSQSRSSIDYRKKCILLVLQTIALFHLCSVIYCHQRQPSFVIKYLIITLVLFNFITYNCVQYDTQQAKHSELLLGESPLLFLCWYGGIIGGGLALLIEKHKHLRSQAFTFRLKLITIFNVTWPFIVYIFYMCRHESLCKEASGVLLSLLEAQHHL